jgi:hypothetical protein
MRFIEAGDDSNVQMQQLRIPLQSRLREFFTIHCSIYTFSKPPKIVEMPQMRNSKRKVRKSLSATVASQPLRRLITPLRGVFDQPFLEALKLEF